MDFVAESSLGLVRGGGGFRSSREGLLRDFRSLGVVGGRCCSLAREDLAGLSCSS